jgi:hypothetical protein
MQDDYENIMFELLVTKRQLDELGYSTRWLNHAIKHLEEQREAKSKSNVVSLVKAAAIEATADAIGGLKRGDRND